MLVVMDDINDMSAQPKLPSEQHIREQTDSVIAMIENRINGCRSLNSIE